MATSKPCNLEMDEDKMESRDDEFEGDSDSSDDSSSDSEDSEDEMEVSENVVDDDELDKQIASLQTEIDGNPYVYEKHTQLIGALRSRGEEARLREARERMSSLFPLTEALWLDWLKDEPDKIELYKRATADYTTVSLWMEYVYHRMRGMADADGKEDVRGAFEQAITAVGLNVAKGSVVWEAYREFELAVLTGLIKESSDSESQMSRITKLFKRQLCVPLIGMENTYSEYKAWIEGEVDAETQRSYEEALKVLGKVRPLEESMKKTDPPHLEIYNKYIELEMSSGCLARVKCIFERAVEQNCLIPDLWIRYTEFLLQNGQPAEAMLPIYRRSVRNCPWAVELWLGLMRATEMLGKPKEDIKSVFNEAMGSGFTQASEYLELWTAYIDYLRRQIDWNTEHGRQLDELRNAFDDAINQLYQSYPVDGDPKCSLTRYWALIEAKFCRNMAKCRELWSQIMQSGYDTESQMWLEYVQLERAFGDVKHCRKILQRALNSVQDWPEVICEAFLRFEREEGDLVHFQTASLLCKEKLKKIAAQRAEEAAKKEKRFDQKKKVTKKPTKSSFAPSSENRPSEMPQKLRPYEKAKKSQKDAKSKESADLNAPVVFVRDAQRKRKLDETVSPPPIPPEAALILDKEGFKIPPPPPIGEIPKPPVSSNPPPGYVPKSSISSDLATNSESEPTEPPSKRVKCDLDDKSIVFISNLDYSVTEDQISEVFAKVGQIKEVQLAKHAKTHLSRGFGHIEFIDELTAAEALNMDRALINGRPVFVSKFEPGESRQSKFKFDVGLEKKKLFVRGLSLSLTEEQVKTEFSKHGKVSAVRLVTYRNGKSKGLAYVEYETEESASQAVLKMDGQSLEGSVVSVAISNPPPRNAPVTEKQPTFVPTLGGGKKDNKHASARTQLSLLPRAVARGPQQQPTSTENGDKTLQKMTNTDFRNMLLKK